MADGYSKAALTHKRAPITDNAIGVSAVSTGGITITTWSRAQQTKIFFLHI
jgi:hypothetical protein